jgi:hypothetical protein
MNLWKFYRQALALAFSTALALPASAGIEPISAEHCALMQSRNVINDDNPIGCDRLRKVDFSFRHFDGSNQLGSIVVMDAFADHVQRIFNELHRRNFPLQQAVGMEVFHGDDQAAMRANNTSAFIGRVITGGSRPSLHAYGAAIDLNPVQNPFLSITAQGTATIDPLMAARTTVNRLVFRPDKPVHRGMAEEVIDLFADNGFIHWGGYWNFPIDYQHFEVAPRVFLERLASLDPAQARREFHGYVERYHGCTAHSSEADPAARRAGCVSEILAYYSKKPWLDIQPLSTLGLEAPEHVQPIP